MAANFGEGKVVAIPADGYLEKPLERDMGLWLILFLAGVTALDAMAIDMYLPAFAELKRSLNLTEGQIQQTLSIFLGGLALGQGLCGPLLERFGRRTPLLIGLFVFVLGSILSAVSTTFSVLLLSRLLQALGASIGLAAPRAIITDKFDAKESAKVFSILMQVMMIAPVIAPLMGTAFLEMWGWRSVFWALAAFAGGALLWGLKITPETLPLNQRKSLDLKPVFKSYWDLFSHKEFASLSLSGALIMGAFFVYLSSTPYIFIQHFGKTPAEFSYLFAANVVGMILLGQLNIYLLKKFTTRRLAYMGIAVFTLAGIGLIFIAGNPSAPWWSYAAFLGIAISSFALIYGNLAALTMEQAKENIGVASGLLGFIQYGVGAGVGFIVSLLPQSISNLPATIIVCGLVAIALLRISKTTKA